MFTIDSITAILLFAQFSILRSRAVLIIANGYVFTALVVGAWISRVSRRFGAKGPDRRIADYDMALCSVALWISLVRNRLCVAKDAGSWQTNLAGHGTGAIAFSVTVKLRP